MLTKNQNIIRWIIVLSSFIIISLILWNTYSFFQHFKAEERGKMEKWTFAYERFSKDLFDDDAEINEVADFIVTDSTVTTPMLLLDKKNNIMSYRNIDSVKISDSLKLKKLVYELQNENIPIDISFGNSDSGTLYYGNSPLLNKLKYYPLALVLIIILFGFKNYSDAKVQINSLIYPISK